MRKVLAGGVCGCSFDLVGVVVQTDDVAAGESCDFSRGFANTTAYVEDGHRLIDLDTMGEVVLMAGESLEESLADAEAA